MDIPTGSAVIGYGAATVENRAAPTFRAFGGDDVLEQKPWNKISKNEDDECHDHEIHPHPLEAPVEQQHHES